MTKTPEIQQHCVDQFIIRSKRKVDVRTAAAKKKTYEAIKTKIMEMLALATPVILKPQYRANQVVRNEYRGLGTYLKYNDWVFVLDEQQENVITCYLASSLRWANA